MRLLLLLFLASALRAAPPGTPPPPSVKPQDLQGTVGGAASRPTARYDSDKSVLELDFGTGAKLSIDLSGAVRKGKTPESWRFTVPLEPFVPPARVSRDGKEAKVASYKMLLFFDWAKGGKLPGRMSFEAPGIELNGRFTADIAGEAAQDPPEVALKDAALKFLARTHKGKTVTVFGSGALDYAPPKASLDVDFKLDGGSPMQERFSFVQDDAGAWKVDAPEPEAPKAGAKPAAPAPIAASAPISEEVSETVKNVPTTEETLKACANELGLYCNEVRADPADALKCLLKADPAGLSAKCRAKLD
jgi:hypothetical protein